MHFITLEEKKDHLIRKAPNLTDEQKQIAIDHFNQFPHKEKEIDWNKLNSLTWEDFEKVIDQESKTRKKKLVKDRGVTGLELGEDYLDISDEEHDVLAYIPLNYESSKLIASHRVGGCEGEWCTAYQKTDNYFIEYTEERGFVLIYTIFRTQLDESPQGKAYDEVTKMAVVHNPDTTETQIFDQHDDYQSPDIFIKATGGYSANRLIRENIEIIEDVQESFGYNPDGDSVEREARREEIEEVIRDLDNGNAPDEAVFRHIMSQLIPEGSLAPDGESWFIPSYIARPWVLNSSNRVIEDLIDDANDRTLEKEGLQINYTGPQAYDLLLKKADTVKLSDASLNLIDKEVNRVKYRWGDDRDFRITEYPRWEDLRFYIRNTENPSEASLFFKDVLLKTLEEALEEANYETDSIISEIERFSDDVEHSFLPVIHVEDDYSISIPPVSCRTLIAEVIEEYVDDGDLHDIYFFNGLDMPLIFNDDLEEAMEDAIRKLNNVFQEEFSDRVFELFESRGKTFVNQLFERTEKPTFLWD